MPDWTAIPIGAAVAVIGLYLAIKHIGGSVTLYVTGGFLILMGAFMIGFGTVYTIIGDTREECAVVGTNADDATYVCVEVTE